MILDEDLTDYEKAGKLSYTPVVQNPDENWTALQGRITAQMIQNFLPEPLHYNEHMKLIADKQEGEQTEVE